MSHKLLFSLVVIFMIVTLTLMKDTFQLDHFLIKEDDSTQVDSQQHKEYHPTLLSNKRETLQHRMKYVLRRNVMYPTTLIKKEPYSCHSLSSRVPLDGTKFSPGVLDFSTWIQTDLSILVVGDSIAMQLAHTLEIAGSNGSFFNRTVFRTYPHPKHHKKVMGTGASPINGGGTIAHLRLNAMWLLKNTNMSLPRSGPGWRINDTNKLREYSLMNHQKMNHYNSRPKTIDDYDDYDDNQSQYEVTIFRVSHPWVHLEEITNDNLKSTVETATSVMGSQTVILTTVWKNNNLFTPDQWEKAKAANRIIRRFAQKHTASSSTSVVLVCDLAKLVNAITHFNAEELGYNTSDSSFLFHNLRIIERKGQKMARSIPQVCAQRAHDGDDACVQNSFFYDGLHLCMMTLGGRINANLACLIACAHNTNNQTHFNRGTSRDALWKCQHRCNRDFMSLRALPHTMIT